MNLKTSFCLILISVTVFKASCQDKTTTSLSADTNYIEALKDTLINLSDQSDNEFFKMHCTSVVSVIDAKSSFNAPDSAFLKNAFLAFNDKNDTASARALQTYIKRQRPFILSWVSPTDGAVSFSWMNPPRNWDPEKEYPLYIQLHGLWSVASNSIEYLTYPFLHNPSADTSFEDGYLLAPWGRGNLWYEGISETDIWECTEVLEDLVHINPHRKYLSGHSMGGYGAWRIASKSANTWAAVGIHAGALWYNNREFITSDVAQVLKNLPVYFVCGTQDDLLEINQRAYDLLEAAGNTNLEFVTFEGGHEYIEANVENMYLWMRNFVKEDLNADKKITGKILCDGLRIECTPNPVTTTSELVYTGPENAIVSINIYDMYGRCVDEITGAAGISGTNSALFDAAGLMPGIYLVCMKSDYGVAGSKITVLK